MDILWQASHQEPAIIRGYMLCDEEKARENLFLKNMAKALVMDNDDSIKGQLVDVLKLLLEGNADHRMVRHPHLCQPPIAGWLSWLFALYPPFPLFVLRRAVGCPAAYTPLPNAHSRT